jgi:P27 family predicted phage terminase small subunit
LKQLGGNAGKRPLNKREPKPATPARKPRGMGEGANKFWDQHAAELKRLEILTGVDVPAFRMAAEMYAMAVQAAAILHEDGLVAKVTQLDKDGEVVTTGIKKHPAFQILRDSATSFRQFAGDFGMTPSARTRLQLPEEAEQLSLADMLFLAVNEEVDVEDAGGD